MAEEQEPTLPRLPSVSWNTETQTFINTRKRGRGQGRSSPLFFNSSDPAVFSSDDDPNLDNYTHGRHARKKKYVGSWYQQQPASSDSTFSEVQTPQPRMKRTFERQFDSGVWMGSDGTDMDDFPEIQQPAASRLPQQNTRPRKVPSLEDTAQQKVLDAVENGQENIDLMFLGLETISNTTVEALSELSCIPMVAEDVPFEQKNPSLKVYLASNPLIRAPGALFNLEFLTFLSLRNTQITELPPALGNLKNLESLNVSLSRLQYLPAELLDLMASPSKLKELYIHPNPLLLKPASRPELPTSATAPTASREWQTLALARSPIQFKNRGVVISKFSFPKTKDRPIIQTEHLSSPIRPPTLLRSASTVSNSRVPSLLELALKSCARADQLPLLASLLTGGPSHLSELVRHIVDQADANANAGDVPCSTCKRRIIFPVAEWVEWHFVRLDSGEQADKVVPFMKRACSWACLPNV